MPQPHFVRFAQALALVTGLAGCGSTPAPTDDAATVDAAIGTDAATETDAATTVDAFVPNDAGARDSAVADAGHDAATPVDAATVDAALDCFTCAACPGDDGPACPTDLLCPCAVPGPLAPPELPV